MEYAPADYVLSVQSRTSPGHQKVTVSSTVVGHVEKVTRTRTRKGPRGCKGELARRAHTVKNDAAQRSALQATLDCGTAPASAWRARHWHGTSALEWHLELEHMRTKKHYCALAGPARPLLAVL